MLLPAPALTAAIVLLTASDRAETFDTLAAGDYGYLFPLALCTAVVLVSLTAYFALPFRAGAPAVVIGLGPLPLLRSPLPPPASGRSSTAAETRPFWSARSQAPPCCASNRRCTDAGTATCSSEPGRRPAVGTGRDGDG
ncbi:hypothetical protein [Streptomyces sp. NPDC005017]|uniref:hypothetical protein n=1 Tax=Streptomyces sp. NPDC005017 TaxID=3364706 RepID=UPI003694809D